MGALEASRDIETGQVASRLVPVPGPMVEQGSRAARPDPGTRAAMPDPGIQGATADQGTPWAMVGSPPKTFSWGSPQPLGGTL